MSVYRFSKLSFFQWFSTAFFHFELVINNNCFYQFYNIWMHSLCDGSNAFMIQLQTQNSSLKIDSIASRCSVKQRFAGIIGSPLTSKSKRYSLIDCSSINHTSYDRRKTIFHMKTSNCCLIQLNFIWLNKLQFHVGKTAS